MVPFQEEQVGNVLVTAYAFAVLRILSQSAQAKLRCGDKQPPISVAYKDEDLVLAQASCPLWVNYALLYSMLTH